MAMLHRLKSTLILFKAKILKRYTPLIAHFTISTNCNFRCRYCKVWKKRKKDLKTEKVFLLLDILKKYGIQRLAIGGGEPLLRKDIGKIIDYSKKKGFYTTITTNGYYLKDRVKYLKNIDAIIVSLDGNEFVHDKQRKKGTFKKIITGIKLAKKAKLNIWTNTALTNISSRNIDYIFYFTKKYKTTAYFQPIRKNSDTARNFDMYKIKEVTKTIRKIADAKRRGINIGQSFETLRKFSKKYPCQSKKCYAGKLHIEIDPEGNMYPCQEVYGEFKPKNIFKDGFERAYKNIKNFKCEGCNCSSICELNSLLSLKLEPIINTIKKQR